MITNNFIKMCEQAEEIQAQWRKPFKNYIGDLYWQGERYLMIPEACICVTEIMFNPKDEHKWLPTQEQLQETIEEVKNKIHMAFRFTDFLHGKYSDTCMPTYVTLNSLSPNYWFTMNEFWLAFVMHEKYHKVWTGKKWVLNE